MRLIEVLEECGLIFPSIGGSAGLFAISAINVVCGLNVVTRGVRWKFSNVKFRKIFYMT